MRASDLYLGQTFIRQPAVNFYIKIYSNNEPQTNTVIYCLKIMVSLTRYEIMLLKIHCMANRLWTPDNNSHMCFFEYAFPGLYYYRKAFH